MSSNGLKSLGEFVRQHYTPAQVWPDKDLENWLEWALDNRFCVLAHDGPELVGLTIFRPLTEALANKILGPDDQYDEDGDIIYVDLTISTRGKASLQAMLFGILARLGNRPRIAFHILKRDKLKVHALHTFKDVLFHRRKIEKD